MPKHDDGSHVQYNPEAARDIDIIPEFFRLSNKVEKDLFYNLLNKDPSIQINDSIKAQLRELVRTLNPSKRFESDELDAAVADHLNDCPKSEYGVWVFFPWSRQMVHLLDEEEFTLLRTNRNQFKITEEERVALSTKKIGIIGLSVGQSVALTLVMERSFGEMRIADFDTLDLSNLNRIRAGVAHLGIKKTVLVARETAEIDPFLKVTCFHAGITPENIDAFIQENGKLDLLIDECDSLDMKILCRQKARSYGIPVLMDTSDRGMIDIERFDLEPDREILHGLAKGLEDPFSAELKDPEKRIRLSMQIAGGNSISERLKISLPKIGKEISTWPQLASSVALGGAVTAEICRKILLGCPIPSGRFYVDIEEIIK